MRGRTAAVVLCLGAVVAPCAGFNAVLLPAGTPRRSGPRAPERDSLRRSPCRPQNPPCHPAPLLPCPPCSSSAPLLLLLLMSLLSAHSLPPVPRSIPVVPPVSPSLVLPSPAPISLRPDRPQSRRQGGGRGRRGCVRPRRRGGPPDGALRPGSRRRLGVVGALCACA